MDKLLNYLKEYAPDYCKELPDDIIMDEIVISKRFGFIKRLVDNDKIDRDKVDEKIPHIFFWYMNYQILLMLLSISDTPIDDLISYLK